MSNKDKQCNAAEFTHTDLTLLSDSQLQHRLDAYLHQLDDSATRQLVHELVRELRTYQLDLKAQGRELKKTQQELVTAHGRCAELYDYSPACHVTFDDAGNIHGINLTAASLLGQDRDNLLGKPFCLWLSENGERRFYAHLNASKQSSEIMTIELQLQLGENSQSDVRLETVSRPKLVEGKALFHSVIIDISDRKQAEQALQHQGRQLRMLSDAMPTFIAYVNNEGRYEFANKVYEDWFQRPREQILGKTVRELVGEESYAEISNYVSTALAGNAVNFEVSYPFSNGEERQFNASYIPDLSDDGSVLGYFTLVRDVTDIHKHELLDRMHLLEMARVSRINSMGEMVAELAHELNQPLAAITIYSDAVARMLRKETLDTSEIQKALNEIRLQAGRAGDVIIRLREFVSKRELQLETIQINTLVVEVMKLIAVEARWHNVEVKLELGEGIPQIDIDRILIEQVVLNLTRNAIEAMGAIERDNRQMVIRTALGNYNEIELSVEDSGPGMPIEETEKIFEPFYTSKEHGMGMGLAISRSIIKEHHGRLWAIPNERGGTTFTIILLYQPMMEE